MILVIDNYDSFTFNLVQILRCMESEIAVYRNDQITKEQAADLLPSGLLISPGPGDPNGAGISKDLVKEFAGTVPILGVCLGHQAIGQVFGGRIVRAKRIVHGKTSMIQSDGKGIFQGIDRPFPGMRYHSLVVEESSLPACFEISARSDDGEIMGLRLRPGIRGKAPVEGVQFHPESIMTPAGKRILANFIRACEPAI
ncbi:MAG: aminodeoxychorismate/anthranilate synthase component II [Planctomycetia bacterium]|nr:aminodeoxychorismate/anthranilate synthase component II [Planctomycetia bacterium]